MSKMTRKEFIKFLEENVPLDCRDNHVQINIRPIKENRWKYSILGPATNIVGEPESESDFISNAFSDEPTNNNLTVQNLIDKLSKHYTSKYIAFEVYAFDQNYMHNQIVSTYVDPTNIRVFSDKVLKTTIIMIRISTLYIEQPNPVQYVIQCTTDLSCRFLLTWEDKIMIFNNPKEAQGYLDNDMKHTESSSSYNYDIIPLGNNCINYRDITKDKIY